MVVKKSFVILTRDNDKIDVDVNQWSEMLYFLNNAGWLPSIPVSFFFKQNYTVAHDEALYLAAAGRIILEEALKDPMSAFQTIRFDMGLFSNGIDFCEKGAFTVCQ